MASLGISDKLFWTITFRKYKNVWFFFCWWNWFTWSMLPRSWWHQQGILTAHLKVLYFLQN